ncbi:hypothetical protein Tco_0735010 [Tanacetum coccineum]
MLLISRIARCYSVRIYDGKDLNFVHEVLEQIHDDDLDEMESKVEYGTFEHEGKEVSIRELKGRLFLLEVTLLENADVPKSKENRNWNQASSSKTVRIEDASEKAMCAIDGGGFDWSDMA